MKALLECTVCEREFTSPADKTGVLIDGILEHGRKFHGGEGPWDAELIEREYES